MLARVLASMLLLLCGPAQAGGDDYDADTDTEHKGPVYYGFVRDNRGAVVPQAQVTLRAKNGGEPAVLTATALGLYRGHLRADVPADQVDVSCAKAGYRQVNVIRRSSPPTSATFEINCVLQRQ